MSIKELASLIGKELFLRDSRTGTHYPATVFDVRSSFGKTQLKVSTGSEADASWFEPTRNELDSARLA